LSPLLDASGRPLLQEAGGERRCVLCVADVRRLDAAREGQNNPDGAGHHGDGLELGVVYGYLVGLDLCAAILIGSGMPPEKAAELQTAASSLCEEHTAAAAAISETSRRPVEAAVSNIRAASVFVVGRQHGRPTGRVGP
jgi:hypothetical protein